MKSAGGALHGPVCGFCSDPVVRGERGKLVSVILSYLYHWTWGKIPGFPKNLRKRWLSGNLLQYQRPALVSADVADSM
jgi:hypothetical protein